MVDGGETHGLSSPFLFVITDHRAHVPSHSISPLPRRTFLRVITFRFGRGRGLAKRSKIRIRWLLPYQQHDHGLDRFRAPRIARTLADRQAVRHSVEGPGGD